MADSHKSYKDYLLLFCFFIAGIITVLLYQKWQNGNIFTNSMAENENIKTTVTSTVTPTPTDDWIPYPTVTPNYVSNTGTNVYSSKKYTIIESQKITAGKTTAETGETVNYTVTLKNTGDKKKFFTHICFNHSGGVTFGCLLNMNLESGKEFNINNSMMYKSPGVYSVWVTWSQDGSNFYRPQGAGNAVVTVY